MSYVYADAVQRQIDQIQDPEEKSRRQAEYDDLSVFRDILPFIPLNVKQYVYYMLGGKGELDENDLTDAELNVLYDIANKKLNDPNFSVSSYSDSNKITYPDYETGDYSDVSRGNPAGKEAQVQEQLNAWERGEKKLNLEGPEGKIKSYSYEEYLQDYPGAFDDPLSVIELAKKLKDPNYSMKTTIGKADIVQNEDDTYSVQDQYDFEYGRGTGESNVDSFSLSPYAVARNLAAKRKNKGSPVDINLGSEEYIKRQGMSNGDEMKKFSKGPSRPSRSTEYRKRLAELEDFIRKNRLVSKEAQMSSMSGEGYTDPRFIKTTGNPLIDQYGMRPFPAEGSGQILSTTDLGMSGKKELFNIENPGRYRTSADGLGSIVYKDISDIYEGTGLTPHTPEGTQKHEIFHRAADKSGWIRSFYNSPYLKKKAKSLSGERGRILTPLINEAVAHSYAYDADDYSKNKELKEEIRFRASKFNLKNPEKIADEIFNNIEDLRDDFEKYIELVNVEYLPNNRISYTTTRTNKATGDEVQSLINEIGIQPIEKEVRNDLRADGTKKSQIGWKGRIVSNVTGKIHTELTIDDKYPLINPYTTEEQIEHLKNNNYEGNAQKLQETEIGREMLLNARRHYEESLQKGVSPFVTDDELQQQKLGLEKKANGGEASYLQSALDMLTESAPVTEAPPGTFDLGTIEPFNPIMERYKPNPIDKFAMNILDPRKKLTVITTPNKMLLKPLFAKRNKLKELIKKQEQNYKRGQDLSSKYDPKDSAQGNYMMNAAIKSGKRFQRQLNELEEKIRKIYQSK